MREVDGCRNMHNVHHDINNHLQYNRFQTLTICLHAEGKESNVMQCSLCEVKYGCSHRLVLVFVENICCGVFVFLLNLV